MVVKKLIYIVRKIEISMFRFALKQLYCICLMLIGVVLSLTVPYLLGKIVNGLYVQQQDRYWYIYVVMLLLCTLFNCIISYIRIMTVQTLGKDISLRLKKYLYKKIMKKKVEFWHAYTVGELETILTTDVNKIEYLFTNFWSQIFVNFFTIAGLSLIILYVLKGYGIIILFLILIMVFVQRIAVKKIEDISQRIRALAGKTAAIETESLMKAEHIYMSGLDEVYLKEFNTKNENLFDCIIHKTRVYAISSNVSNIFQIVNIMFILLLGAFLIRKDILTIDMAISMYLYIQKLLTPTSQVVTQIMNAFEIFPSVDRLIDLLNNDEDVEFGMNYPNEKIQTICFDKVYYKYDKQKNYIFKSMSKQIHTQPGKLIIVGENGKGKTTLIRLLLNMCKIESGEILINNYKLKELSEKYIRDNIAFLSQNPLVFGKNFLENINPNGSVDEEKIKEILCNLGISESWIREKSNVVVSDKNNNFSGGELQKIAIARVLLEEKPIIIMDEPTSALDIHSIFKLMEVLDEYAKKHLLIIISHDSYIREWGDDIISLDYMDE